jgi:hypothetical protein
VLRARWCDAGDTARAAFDELCEQVLEMNCWWSLHPHLQVLHNHLILNNILNIAAAGHSGCAVGRCAI